jgi:hypothetical protein
MAGWHVWVDDDVIEASDLNSYLMAQCIPRFADATARDAAIGTPAVGQVCFLTSAHYQQYDGSDWVALLPVPPGGTTGQVLTKASDDDYDVEWIDLP